MGGIGVRLPLEEFTQAQVLTNSFCVGSGVPSCHTTNSIREGAILMK